jgi:hypothetical protein
VINDERPYQRYWALRSFQKGVCYHLLGKVKVKVKFALEEAMKARGGVEV